MRPPNCPPQVPTDDASELDGLDEAICPVDMNIIAGTLLIQHDHSLLMLATAQTLETVFMLASVEASSAAMQLLL